MCTETADSDVAMSVLIREYLDRDVAVYDAGRKRIGAVTDYDCAGGCIVVRMNGPAQALCIPFSFVTRVRRGKAYLSKFIAELYGRRGTP